MARSRHRRRWLLLLAVVLATTVVVVVSELALRSAATERMAERADLPLGAAVEIGAAPMLWQLANGRVELRLAIPESELGEAIACVVGHPVVADAITGAVLVSVDATVRDFSLPVTATIVPQHSADAWSLVVESVSVAGVRVPIARVAQFLDLGDAAGGLEHGIPLPSGGIGGWDITAIEVSESSLVLLVAAPLGDSPASPPLDTGKLADCLTPSTESNR